jgi:hypothetical protein
MQFLQTNAIDLNGLLIAIKNFLSAHGWTVLADGTGGGGLTLEMTNANGHSFKFTSATVARTRYATGVAVAFNDRLLKVAFQKSDIGMAAGYTTHRANERHATVRFRTFGCYRQRRDVLPCRYANRQCAVQPFQLRRSGQRGLACGQPSVRVRALLSAMEPEGRLANSNRLQRVHRRSRRHNVGFFCEGATNRSCLAGNAFPRRHSRRRC